MTSGKTMGCEPILVLGLLIWAAYSSTIEDCNFEETDITTIESPKTFQCQEDPVYKLTSQKPGLLGAIFWDEPQENLNAWSFHLDPPLNLEVAGTCPSEMKDVVCETFLLVIGSSFEEKDGSTIVFQGEQRFGEVAWICNATDQNGDYFDAYFYFYIIATNSDSESDITSDGAEYLKNVLWKSDDPHTDNTDDLDIMKLQKFDKVTADSELIFAQGDDEEGHCKGVLFTSEDVAIKVSENMYNTMTTSGPPSNARVTGQTVADDTPCEHYYKLVFNGEGMTKFSREVFLFILALSFMVFKFIE